MTIRRKTLKYKEKDKRITYKNILGIADIEEKYEIEKRQRTK